MSSLKTIILSYILVCVFLVPPCCVHRDRRPDPTVSVVPSPRFVLFVFSSLLFCSCVLSLAASESARRSPSCPRRSREFTPPFAALPSRSSREFTRVHAAVRGSAIPPFAGVHAAARGSAIPPFAAQPSRRSREFTPPFADQPAHRSQEMTPPPSTANPSPPARR